MAEPQQPPPPLPDDPSLADAPAVRAALEALWEGLDAGGVTAVPALGAVPEIVWVRWLYRGWLEEQPGWRPLVHVAPRFLGGDPAPLREAAALAAGGWLFVEAGDLPLPEADLAAEARRRGARLLRPAGGEPLPLPEATARRLLYLDRHHLVAADPSLSDLRRSLLSHCRSRSPIHLAGPPGTGKKALAFWAHSRLDLRPMSHVRRGGARRPSPGQWELYEEVGELEPEQLHPLRQRLKEAEDLPPAPAGSDDEAPSRPDHPAFDPIRGRSPALCRVLAQAARIARHPMSVLILGESGVGKEALARAVHEASGRPGPYRIADVSTLNEELVESELFGHTQGAFTGAHRERVGALRAADRGTLFLDELGNLSPRVQAKLLRFLQEKTVQPVGSDRVHAVDVRVIAATNADLEGMVARGEFREDLLRRLDAVTLRAPPLRERPDDVVPLARTFIEQARGSAPLSEPWLTPDARRILLAHTWPGNVRELQNVMAQAAAETDAVVDAPHLGPLSPRNRRPVPLLTTSSEEGLERVEGLALERHLVQRMTAVTLRLPALRDRGTRSVRNAVLGLLDGRPIRAEGLSALERRPWWGNFTELLADLGAIRANVDGVVDAPALRRVLPHLLQPGGRAPIRVLMDPAVEADGTVSGLQKEFPEGALLVGRVRDLGELARAAGDAPGGDGGPVAADGERMRARLQAVRALLGPVPVACLDLGHVRPLGRAHVLVTRGPAGLRVHALPEVALPVWAGPLDPPGAPLRAARPGAPVEIGAAGEVQVRPFRDGPPLLQLFLFAGAVAQEEFGRAAAERARRARPAPGPTALLETDPGDREGEKKVGIWALDAEEREVLNGIVLRYRGGDFKAHLEGELQPRVNETACARLARYLLGARPTQYCARLYGHRLNAELRADLCDALVDSGDPLGRLRQLPASIAQEVEPALLERVEG